MLKSLNYRIDAAAWFSIITFQVKLKQVSVFAFLFPSMILLYITSLFGKKKSIDVLSERFQHS